MTAKLKCFVTVSLGLCGSLAFGHERAVHQQITRNAAASAQMYSSSYRNFCDAASSDIDYSNAVYYMAEGSFQEDNADQDAGGNRSYNHFYDPITGLGLSDIPPDVRETVGTNSLAWASVSNCPGLDFHTKYLGVRVFIADNVNTSNQWSWQNARGYEWQGLTATNHSGRQAALTNMFRAVGQVMHLLEDDSQPQHVRNEQHVNPFTSKLASGFDPWNSPIEAYGLCLLYTSPSPRDCS